MTMNRNQTITKAARQAEPAPTCCRRTEHDLPGHKLEPVKSPIELSQNPFAVTADEALRIELNRTRWALQQTRAELDRTRAFLACVRTQLGSERSRRLAELRARYTKRPSLLTRLWDSITIFCAGLQMALRKEN